ncbi:MAG: saccharopine dehydrogenase family protein [Sphingomonadales bacterium]|jgi:saccharopine dehydrogenase-like NADP-dependent oxidoreductase
MTNILLLGAGKIGEMIAFLLSGTGDYHVTVADSDLKNLTAISDIDGVSILELDISDIKGLVSAMDGKFAVLSACPFQLNPIIARAAKIAKINYLDLTEDVESTRLVKELAQDANGYSFIPQCGLAPGFISIVGFDLAQNFDHLQNVHLRVGALAQFPNNALKYNLTWSTDGLINEYIKPCECISGGKLVESPPLEELEVFSMDGTEYEAFNTSGGLGTLCETLEGKVQNLNYRTVRYPGHRDILKILLQDLRLGERPDLMKDIFETAIPMTKQDVVLVHATVTGMKNGKYMQETYANKVYAREINRKTWTGIQITTASGICAVLDLLVDEKLPKTGFVKQEDISFKDFIENRFGSNYAYKTK